MISVAGIQDRNCFNLLLERSVPSTTNSIQLRQDMSEIKKMYSTILGDHFPLEMTISFGDQKLVIVNVPGISNRKTAALMSGEYVMAKIPTRKQHSTSSLMAT